MRNRKKTYTPLYAFTNSSKTQTRNAATGQSTNTPWHTVPKYRGPSHADGTFWIEWTCPSKCPWSVTHRDPPNSPPWARSRLSSTHGHCATESNGARPGDQSETWCCGQCTLPTSQRRFLFPPLWADASLADCRRTNNARRWRSEKGFWGPKKFTLYFPIKQPK